MKRIFRLAAVALLCVALSPQAAAEDLYFDVPVRELTITSGALPSAEEGSGSLSWRNWSHQRPRVALSAGVGYLVGNFDYWNWPTRFLDEGRVVMRIPRGESVSGALVLPDTKRGDGSWRVGFTVSPDRADRKVRPAWWAAHREHYESLVQSGYPGAAWFRYKLQGLDEGVPDGGNAPDRLGAGNDDLERTLGLFTGTQALAENLQLDRVLQPRGADEETVALSELEGIEVQPLDFGALLGDREPGLDPLAGAIPGDQHALFFPTFQDLLTLSDEADAFGTPVLALTEMRAEDRGTKDRVQEQLALEVSQVARVLGPKVVRSVAVTGSDPFLRMGADIAVLFEARNVALLLAHIQGKQQAALAGHPGATAQQGELSGLVWRGVCSPARTVCSYVAVRGETVMVTNSLAQLARLAALAPGGPESLAQSAEYRFFRERYGLGDAEESAFLVLPDAAIRRWCSPRWRIADSRRVRAAAILSHLHAAHAEALVSGETSARLELPKLPAELGEVTVQEGQFHSSTYGSIGFMTPILELDIARVTRAEADAYQWFKDRYQRNWRDYFDPIAVRFHVSAKRVMADVSVMPLIAGSDYRELITLTTGRALAPTGGDPHEDILFRWGLSLNPDSAPVRQVAGFAVSMAPGLKGNALSWLGDSIVVYGDQDAFWEEFVRSVRENEYVERHFNRLPVAIRVAISSPLKATAFLATVRGFIEQTAPGMTLWENLEHKGSTYVKVSPARDWDDDLPDDLAVYYAITGRSLLLTLHEGMLKRALARDAKRGKSEAAARKVDGRGKPWLGEQVGFQATGDVLELLEAGARREFLPELQDRSWRNLPILNEWHRLFPTRDPVAVHRALFGTTLRCPGGGEYVWNARWRTMESTVMGHPARPGAPDELFRPPLADLTWGNFGLTFEHGGLRARAELWRRVRNPHTVIGGAILRAVRAHPRGPWGTLRGVFLLTSRLLGLCRNLLP